MTAYQRTRTSPEATVRRVSRGSSGACYVMAILQPEAVTTEVAASMVEQLFTCKENVLEAQW
eukprot:11447226-Karenia_brevis.AAC.1